MIALDALMKLSGNTFGNCKKEMYIKEAHLSSEFIPTKINDFILHDKIVFLQLFSWSAKPV